MTAAKGVFIVLLSTRPRLAKKAEGRNHVASQHHTGPCLMISILFTLAFVGVMLFIGGRIVLGWILPKRRR
ncbi:hypothetical protein [Nitrobacter sp.]|uniref:hypothetical protein n=1 Tax=Nitrobacter sp. TaxID=29420 RepID=UPI0029CABA83|nr:hypothetical protein [Nitrobacter sp.]